jgi:NifB/MoaA-like Fe-S oxidoreductase
MVVVPGLNDGAVLEESLTDLWNLGDAVLSAAVVPVGLTQFSHLYTGNPMDAAAAGSLLDDVARWSDRAMRERGENWVYGSDELYLLAERDVPGADHYGDFSQIENGIGAVASLRLRVAGGLADLPRMNGRKIGVVTGKAMAGLMPELLAALRHATGAEFELIVAESSLFGPTITTAGLLVGADIRRVLGDRHDLSLALIPAETLNDDRVFLDDVDFEELRAVLPIPVFPSYDFIDFLAAEAEAVAA